MTDRELDEIMTFRWPAVVRRTLAESTDDWTRGFVRSIARQGKRPSWRPSPKQAALMRQLISQLYIGAEEELEVIER